MKEMIGKGDIPQASLLLQYEWWLLIMMVTYHVHIKA